MQRNGQVMLLGNFHLHPTTASAKARLTDYNVAGERPLCALDENDLRTLQRAGTCSQLLMVSTKLKH